MTVYIPAMVIIILTLLLLPWYFMAGLPIIQYSVIVAAISASAAAVIIIFIVVRRPHDKLMPLIVYSNGVSLRFGPKPYYSFSDIFHVEEYVYSDSETPVPTIHTGITFVDEDFQTVPLAAFNDETAFRAFHNTLAGRLFKVRRGLAWGPDAEAFMSSLPCIKGVARLRIENWARDHGEKAVTLDLVRLNWQDMFKGPRANVGDFKYFARKRLSKSP